MKKNSITWITQQSGQEGSHKDSVYKYIIESDLPERLVKDFCIKWLKRAKNEGGDTFDGSTSFPFGLESFYQFKKLKENKYEYIVCYPYTG